MTKNNSRLAAVCAMALGFLSACSPEDTAHQTPRPSSGVEQNARPTLSGVPPTSVVAGTPYSFAPSATDDDGDEIWWTIQGKPAWAYFNPATGELTGTPDSTGVHPNIIITASDGKDRTSVGPFSISVLGRLATAPPPGSAVVSWSGPGAFTDGRSLDPSRDLTGYHIYHGTSPSSLELIAEVDAATTSFTVRDLGRGTHFFAVTAVSQGNAESAYSTLGTKTIS